MALAYSVCWSGPTQALGNGVDSRPYW